MGTPQPDVTCCPPFEPALWDGRVFEWKDKRFIRGRVFTLFYVPVNFGKTMKHLMGQITAAGGSVPDYLCLSDHTSKWSMNVYLAADREIPGAETALLSGTFLAKVYEGPYQNTGKWCKDYEAYVREKALDIKKWYMWYTTCPKCAKKYGRNYVAIMSQVEPRGGI